MGCSILIPLLATAHVYNHFRSPLLCGEVVVHLIDRFYLAVVYSVKTTSVKDGFFSVRLAFTVCIRKIKWITRLEELPYLLD